jgi:hypothetical protein
MLHVCLVQKPRSVETALTNTLSVNIDSLSLPHLALRRRQIIASIKSKPARCVGLGQRLSVIQPRPIAPVCMPIWLLFATNNAMNRRCVLRYGKWKRHSCIMTRLGHFVGSSHYTARGRYPSLSRSRVTSIGSFYSTLSRLPTATWPRFKIAGQ